MIELFNVSKSYSTPKGKKEVLKPCTVSFPKGRNIGLLGVNGAGKSTLLRMIAGSEAPTTGVIKRKVKMSWPLGFAGGFNGSLTGAENLRFVSRIYGANIKEVTAFVREFSELGDYLDMPIRSYSSGMKARLAFGLSMAMDFDCYLVDEITGVGDRRFQEKCRVEFKDRSEKSSLIMVSHSMPTLKEHCDMGLVLSDGVLTFFEDINEAIDKYLTLSK
ncbi:MULTISPECIES: ABC transporter ATP-binding protein [Vibrio]|uniref:ABC-type polysaccharide/polyol phosphate transport system ATPase component n=2 Tax=Vibrio antiquarius (strain Ex25) TaxID=150340 RepID=A0ACA6QHZ1_VIBAE|nr:MULTISPECIES: ABC transporter ATP-binding protein [Vibrio]ACY49946.1 ABC-type polysaccharide/polyol phosphate transport system ATPase component [Vibrio antiquarius]EDN56865.1 ATP-binding protein BexA [Vibrio antiquarius]EGQ7649200.1 ABC transporter ATP-binding protein [Vibrio alginolyticus]ELA9458822.1 ABC transporter ATP-binding protein [Vibrio alginolyticus]ELB2154876.1 ABC transporter ATP-binding protein [Vibrio parahaemolyticus]